ncbi:hypothetical protein BXZ70DRAFT_918855 [Cristinia sonorae]|uniref:Complex 1 LYR protein n=1 Tax=Cristinia sonorae TaxID=1940300 RepID=A0A8K0XTS8_9AGAR|nr:hypothetical protein BXZ70DRAFT_918855 [Cristinia sonorae]
MATLKRLALYRSIIREVNLSCPVPRAERNVTIFRHYRTIFERSLQTKDEQTFERDMGNLVTFLRAQRLHKVLLERYNPLHDLTAEERIRATARRVGLDMPVEPEKQ